VNASGIALAFPYLLSFIAGGAVGVLFFWGLWTSLQIAGKSDKKALILIGSFLLRAALAVGVMIASLHLTDVYGLLACMAGFLVARIVITRTLRRSYG
jgi:F1F0 ATPase subunit 2